MLLVTVISFLLLQPASYQVAELLVLVASPLENDISALLKVKKSSESNVLPVFIPSAVPAWMVKLFSEVTT